jgi:hypothetical protein
LPGAFFVVLGLGAGRRPFGFAGGVPNGAGVPRFGRAGGVPSGAGFAPGRFVAGFLEVGFGDATTELTFFAISRALRPVIPKRLLISFSVLSRRRRCCTRLAAHN